MLVTVFVPFALLKLDLTAFELGVTLAAAGRGGLLGSLVSTRVGLRWGAGQLLSGLAIGVENANEMGGVFTISLAASPFRTARHGD